LVYAHSLAPVRRAFQASLKKNFSVMPKAGFILWPKKSSGKYFPLLFSNLKAIFILSLAG
jgi:hypothetical protein